MLGILYARLLAAPLSPYGEEGAEYLEHSDRLATVLAWRRGLGEPLELLRAVDHAFPPGIHAVGAPFGAMFGHEAEVVSLVAPLFLLLLALGTGLVAGSFDPGGAEPARYRGTVAAGWIAGLLLPAAHAAATRYHYDLPMAALLWAALAAQVTLQDRRPLLGGLLSGGLLAAAAFTKWSALPLGVPLLTAGLLAPRHRARLAAAVPWRHRLLGFAATGGVSAALVAGWLSVSMRSLLAMAGTFEGTDAESSAWPGFDGGVLDGALAILGAVGDAVPGQPGERLLTYGAHVVTAMVSPIGALYLLVIGALWLRAGARGGLFALVAVGGQVAFQVLGTPPMDERFLLAALPVAAVVTALVCRRRRGGPRLGQLGVALGLLLAVDVHLAPEAPWNRPWILLRNDTEMPFTTARGISLASSFGQRGWVRRDEQRPPRRAQREQVWRALAACEPLTVAFGARVIGATGDAIWWQYRRRLAAVRGEHEPRTVAEGNPDLQQVDPRWALVVTGESGVGLLEDLGGRWEAVERLPEPGGSSEVTLWRRVGSRVCADASDGSGASEE